MAVTSITPSAAGATLSPNIPGQAWSLFIGAPATIPPPAGTVIRPGAGALGASTYGNAPAPLKDLPLDAAFFRAWVIRKSGVFVPAGLSLGLPAAGTVIWDSSLGPNGQSTPAEVNGRLYFACQVLGIDGNDVLMVRGSCDGGVTYNQITAALDALSANQIVQWGPAIYTTVACFRVSGNGFGSRVLLLSQAG
jgi:hypothetical protein